MFTLTFKLIISGNSCNLNLVIFIDHRKIKLLFYKTWMKYSIGNCFLDDEKGEVPLLLMNHLLKDILFVLILEKKKTMSCHCEMKTLNVNSG